jgi:ribA/ribD-fused uncharacterized protein
MANTRTYLPASSIVFHKTKAEFGGLSNMAAGYSVNINDVIIPTIEHLYQACRFPHLPQLQLDIISAPSPMKAKWIGRAQINLSRKDWDRVRFKIMQWCIEVKLSQNWESFGSLLRSTDSKPIVELAPRDKIWGATKDGDQLVGTNALGRLLMYVRERYVKTNDCQRCVHPLTIPNFTLLGNPIDRVCNENHLEEIRWSQDDAIVHA